MPDVLPIWAALSFLGAAGGMFRFLLSKNIAFREILAMIGLGACLAPTISLMLVSMAKGQNLTIGEPAQCLLAICIGGASVFLFDRLQKSLEWFGDLVIGKAEAKFGGGKPPESSEAKPKDEEKKP